jgi:hypothetical protein
VAVLVAFFAVAIAYVKGCELIVGPDTPLPDEGGGGSDAAHGDAAEASAATGGPAARRSGDR